MTDEEIEYGIETACNYANSNPSPCWTVNPYPIIRDYIQRLKAENAALRERLEKAVEPPKPFIEQDSDGYYRVYSSRISIIRYAKQHGVYDTPEAAEARLKDLQGGKQ